MANNPTANHVLTSKTTSTALPRRPPLASTAVSTMRPFVFFMAQLQLVANKNGFRLNRFSYLRVGGERVQ